MEELKGRILCIDDDRSTCEMLEVVLGTIGYEAQCATTVTEGLRLAKEGGFDLLLLDSYFRDGTGVELCQMIRTFDLKTPIAFYSGAADDSDIEAAKQAGAQGYLIKPCRIEKLERTIGLLVGKKRLEASKEQSKESVSTSRALMEDAGRTISRFRQGGNLDQAE